MSQYQTISAGVTERVFSVVAKASGDAITSGTVNYYLKAKSGANAGKWWKDDDQTWAATETANAMTHDADGMWEIELAASPFEHGVRYLEYAKESGDLHVAGNGRHLICQAAPGTENGLPINDANGRVPAQVEGIDANAITEASIADSALTAAKFASGAFAAVWSALTSGMTTEGGIGKAIIDAFAALTARLTSTRAAYLDNLAGGMVATQADVAAITVASRVRIVTPPQFERPDDDTPSSYRIWIYHYDGQGLAEDLDAPPSVTAQNNAGVDRSDNLGTVTKPDATTGQYYVDYAVSESHAVEGLVFKVAATEGAVETVYPASTHVVDTTAVDFTAADRSKLNDLEGRLTSARAVYLDKLNVSGTLAHSDAADTYKADVSGLALEDTAQAIKLQSDKLSFAGDDVKATLDGEEVKLASDGLDQISADIPNGIATTFPGRLMQLWGRFFGKHVKDKVNSKIVTYREDGTTPNTQQPYSKSATEETVSAAEPYSE